MDPTLWFFLIIAVVWLYRARRALQAFKTIPSVRPAAEHSHSRDLVTVVLPARNEEKNIQPCLERLLAQDYPHLQILVANDRSTDATESILKEMGIPEISREEKAPNEKYSRVAYINVPETPAGWTGKNYAVHCAAEFARGQWLLFTDADTRHETNSVTSVLEHVKKSSLRFLTLIPRCLTGSFLEDMIQPSAMGFLGLWFPLEKVNSPDENTIFGNGQFLFIDRELYQELGGHESVKGEFLEDYAFMRAAKKLKAPVQGANGVSIFGTRMYDSFDSMWRGWRRIYLHAFERRPFRILEKFLSLMFFSVLPFACFLPMTRMAADFPDTYGFSWGMSVVVLAFIVFTSWKAYGLIQAKKRFAFLHPVAALLIAMFILDAWILAVQKKETTWR